MTRKYELLRDAVREFYPRFTVAMPKVSAIPTEHSLPQVIESLKLALEEGQPITEPRPLMAGQDFQGFQIAVCEPVQPNAPPQAILLLTIHAGPADIGNPAVGSDQRVIAHAIIAIAVGSFLEEAKAKLAKQSAGPEGDGGAVVAFKAAE